MTPHHAYSRNGITVTAADLGPLLTLADSLATEFIATVRLLLESPQVLENPCILYSPSVFLFGELRDLIEFENGEQVCHIFPLPFWKCCKTGDVANLLLHEEGETFRSLMLVGFAIGAIHRLGTNDAREEYLRERMNAFVALAHHKAHLEACA